jgi:hypothetical protein
MNCLVIFLPSMFLPACERPGEPIEMMTVADLYRTEGKAELVGGKIIHLPPMAQGPDRGADCAKSRRLRQCHRSR